VTTAPSVAALDGARVPAVEQMNASLRADGIVG
jgi:hypothetical protein